MKIQTGKGTISLTVLIAIWSVSAVVSLPGLAVSPILGDMHTIFSKVSDLEIQMLTSLPSVLIIPFVLISGRLSVGRDKTMLLIAGMAMFFACSVMYFFAGSMRALIVISSLMGIGAGIVVPLSTGLVTDYFSGPRRIRQLGLCSSINNLTLVLATALAGYLAGKNWHLPFTVYLLSGVSLALAVVLRRNRESIPAKRMKKESSEAGHLNWKRLAPLALFYFFITYAVLAISYYVPFLVQDHKMDSSLSGVLISLFFLAIMLPGFILNNLITGMKREINIVALCMVCIGLIVIGLLHYRWTMVAGCILTGLGYGIMQPIIYEKTASATSASLSTLALSIVMAANYLAIVLCPFIIELLRKAAHTRSDAFPFWFNAIPVACLIVWSILHRDSPTLGMDRSYYEKNATQK